jgi:hypothetical protein
MKRTDDERTTKIDSAHADSAANMPHDRNELPALSERIDQRS